MSTPTPEDELLNAIGDLQGTLDDIRASRHQAHEYRVQEAHYRNLAEISEAAAQELIDDIKAQSLPLRDAVDKLHPRSEVPIREEKP